MLILLRHSKQLIKLVRLRLFCDTILPDPSVILLPMIERKTKVVSRLLQISYFSIELPHFEVKFLL
jgi:hypothetical protein